MPADPAGAIVLCSTRGLGYAVAEALACRAVPVAICGRTPESVSAAEKRLSSLGRVRGWTADIRDQESLAGFVDTAAEWLGRVGILVTNTAPSSGHGQFTDIPLERWTVEFQRLVLPVIHACQLVIPHLVRSGGGSIVHITTGALVTPVRDHTISMTLRSAVQGLATVLSAQHGQHGIRVNCVAPFGVVTPTLAERLGAERLRRRTAEVSLRRLGEPGDVASAVTFLALDAGFVTGTTLAVDGGFARAW